MSSRHVCFVSLFCSRNILAIAFAATLAMIASSSLVHAATRFDGDSGTNWWFDPVNWSAHGVGAVAPFYLPPTNDGETVTDANLNDGWNLDGEGVVYDPVNDPFFVAAGDPNTFHFPTEQSPLFDRDTIWRFYITTGSAETDNLLTVKSGELEVINNPSGSSGYTLLGRGGATSGLKGTIVQTGGGFFVRDDNLDIGSFSGNFGGNGVYEYHGGTLEAGLISASNKGIRLSAGGSAGSAESGSILVHNGGEAGHIRTWNFNVGAHIDTLFGVTSSVSTTHFFADQDGTRPIQVMSSMSINHQDDSGVSGSTRSAVLQLDLDASPAVDGLGVPLDMGLFDLVDPNGGITGQSGIFYDDSIANSGQPYSEGDVVTADYAGSTYNWTISYSGNISWNDFDNSDVASVTGTGTGNDIVLIGLSSVIVGIPGDFNGDLDVDGKDFLIWQQGGSPNPLSASDLNDWKTNYGFQSLTAAVSAVPEPASGLLGVVLVGLLLGRRQRLGG